MTSPNEGPRGRRFVSTVVEVEGRSETKVVELPDRELEPWPDDLPLEVVGQRVPRVDGRDKVTGRARYTADVQRPGMLHAVLVRSPVAAGEVREIDASDALRLAGVVDVVTARDLPRPMRAGGATFLSGTVRYPHQPVAVVCAETRQQALRAASLVRVQVEASPFVLDPTRALDAGAPLVRGTSNLMRGEEEVAERGDVLLGLAEAEVVVTREYHTSSVLHTPLEPHGAVAEWEGDRLTVWESTQGVFRVRDEVAAAMGVPRSHVRVVMEHMGGGFGAKNYAGAHTLAAALLARRTGRAVRCVLEREEEMVDGGHRPPTRQVVSLGATRAGRLVAIDMECEVGLGAGGWEGGPGGIFRELYSCPNVRTRERFVYVHTQPMMAFRAPGHVEGAFALERTMDVLARELGMDPLALRLANFAEGDESKGRPYSANGLRRCYEEGARRFGWGEGGEEEGRRGGTGTGGGEMVVREGGREGNVLVGGAPRALRRGVGMAACVWPAGGGPPAYATVRLNADASVEVSSGTQDLGTGARTVLAQVAAESLGARLADVRVVLGDTERSPYAGNSWGSMTTASVGPAVRAAAEEARGRLLEAASQLLECHPDDLEARQSVITTRDGARRMTFAEVTKRLGNVMIMGRGSRGPNPQGVGLMSFGAQFAEVEVDAETGVVRVLRIVAAHDAGRILNPLLAESQLHGGIIQGLGFALFEERHLDSATGVPLNASMHDYKVPTLADVPRIDAFFVHGSDQVANSLGARGLAEPPIIPTAPAIANAVANALGVELAALPLTPWRVLQAIGRAES